MKVSDVDGKTQFGRAAAVDPIRSAQRHFRPSPAVIPCRSHGAETDRERDPGCMMTFARTELPSYPSYRRNVAIALAPGDKRAISKRPSTRGPLAPAPTTSVHPCGGPSSVGCAAATTGVGVSQGAPRRRSIMTDRKGSSGKMRHVRILRLCLVAMFAMSAVAAASASAEEHLKLSWAKFQNCPVEYKQPHLEGYYSEGTFCFFAYTEKGPQGGHFTVGNITVPLTKQVTLQYLGARYEDEATGIDHEAFVAPLHGVEAISPTPEKVPGEPIAHITPTEQEELGWPEGLKRRYLEGQRNRSVKTVTETIELAGEPETSTDNLLNAEGTAIEAPVKIKGENKWLSSLGDVCYIGSNSEPIVQHLTTGESTSPLTHETIRGNVGELGFYHDFELISISDNTLVDNTYPVPGASCFGTYSGYIEATIDKEFSIPAAAGASVTELHGTLYDTSAESVAKHGF